MKRATGDQLVDPGGALSPPAFKTKLGGVWRRRLHPPGRCRIETIVSRTVMMNHLDDPFDLARFVTAQSGVFDRALAEVRGGRKTGHWMWFVYPQLAGLGSSPTARRFAIQSLSEARAYLAHPLLGPRLLSAATAAAALVGRSAAEVFGSPDDLKLRSSLTLFEAADPNLTVFGAALDVLCAGDRDSRTLALLQSGAVADPSGTS